MSNLEKYNQAFIDVFVINSEQLIYLEYQSIEAWNSVGHMQLMEKLEETFDIMIETDDIIEFSSYLKGKEILSKEEYGVVF